MSEFFLVDSRGKLVPESQEVQDRLAEHAGRFYLAPTSPNLLLGVRSPCSDQKGPPVRVIMAGDLSGIPLADLVAFLNQTRITGLLRVVSAGGERALYLSHGEIHSSASDDVAESVGEIAVRLGLCTRAQLKHALASNPPLARVGRLLVESQALQPHDLWRCMQQQASEIFHSILVLERGAFMLVEQPIEDRGGLALSTQGLLMDAIRRIDEMKEFRKRLPSSQAYVIRLKPAGPGLDEHERQVYGQCTGEQTVAQIGQALRLSEFDVTKLLHHLIERGLVAASSTVQSAPKVAPAPTPEEVIRVFNFVYREIVTEIRKVNMATEFVAAANGAIAQQALRNQVLWGLSFDSDGALCDGLLANLQKLNQPADESIHLVHSALSELMFFMLFEAGELLEPAVDEDLARRVKGLLSTLEGVG